MGVGEGLEEAAGVTGLAVAVLTTLSSETVPKVIRLGPSEDSDGATADLTGTGDDGSAIVPNDRVGARQEKSEFENMSKMGAHARLKSPGFCEGWMPFGTLTPSLKVELKLDGPPSADGLRE